MLVPYYLFNVLVQSEVKAKILPRQLPPHSPRTPQDWKDVTSNYTDVYPFYFIYLLFAIIYF